MNSVAASLAGKQLVIHIYGSSRDPKLTKRLTLVFEDKKRCSTVRDSIVKHQQEVRTDLVQRITQPGGVFDYCDFENL